jgi:hypothetical protein
VTWFVAFSCAHRSDARDSRGWGSSGEGSQRTPTSSGFRKRLLRERERLVRDAHDPHGGAPSGATFGLAADIEDVLDRRGVDSPSAEEILDAKRGRGAS